MKIPVASLPGDFYFRGMAVNEPTASAIMPPDLHIHTPFSRHASGSMEETVEAAVRKGFAEIGFADHFYYPDDYVEPAPDCVIPDRNAFEQYVLEIERLQVRFRGRIAIRLGAEIDYIPDRMEDVRGELARYPFDYLIGSIHAVNGVAFDYREDWLAARFDRLGGPEGLWKTYWRDMERFVSLDLFDIAGHFDLPKKFGIARVDTDFSQPIGRVFDLMDRYRVAIEVNTGGIDRAANRETYPSMDLLRRAAARGIAVAFGSDAHRPEDVGRYFSETSSLLRSEGVTQALTFVQREPRAVSIA